MKPEEAVMEYDELAHADMEQWHYFVKTLFASKPENKQLPWNGGEDYTVYEDQIANQTYFHYNGQYYHVHFIYEGPVIEDADFTPIEEMYLSSTVFNSWYMTCGPTQAGRLLSFDPAAKTFTVSYFEHDVADGFIQETIELGEEKWSFVSDPEAEFGYRFNYIQG